MATAWAPPTAYTSATPSRAHAASTKGCGRPVSFCGGLATARDSTPATWAGTTFMTTDDGYTASPPGTYRPTRATGRQRWVTVPPGTTVVVTSSRRWAVCTVRARAIDSVSAARTVSSSAAPAAWISATGTRNAPSATPSKRSVASRTAGAPCSRIASTTGRTASIAAATSSAARGSSRRGFTVEPRRSIRFGTPASLGRLSSLGRRRSTVWTRGRRRGDGPGRPPAGGRRPLRRRHPLAPLVQARRVVVLERRRRFSGEVRRERVHVVVPAAPVAGDVLLREAGVVEHHQGPVGRRRAQFDHDAGVRLAREQPAQLDPLGPPALHDVEVGPLALGLAHLEDDALAGGEGAA